jgi:ubiquinone/menaquinone biosynthesis C-methylase UbiE
MYSDIYIRLIARNYDGVYSIDRTPSGDADFYRDLARESGGPVLELGCGTGRVLLPIAREGIECVGLDASPEMLSIFRDKAPPPNLTLVEGRMQSFDLGARRFALITCPFRAFSHLLDVADQLEALARIRHHLAPGGAFAFDLFDPRFDRLAAPFEEETLRATFQHEGHEVRRWDSSTRDHTRQILTVHFRFEGGPPEMTGTADLQLRWFNRYELEHLLHRAGFTDVTFYGHFDRRPWAAFGETIVVAR